MLSAIWLGSTRQVHADDSEAALKWYRGLKQAILDLEELPNRCPVTPENNKLRHLLYGNKPPIYRAICRVIEKHKKVEVIHIRHCPRHEFQVSDLA